MGSCCSAIPESNAETETSQLITKETQPTKFTPNTPINLDKENPPSLPNKKNIPFGESYKNRKENELLQNILQQTQNNLINISQSPGVIQLGMNNKVQVNQLLLKKELNNEELFGLPVFLETEDVKQTLLESKIAQKDLNLLDQLNQNILKSFKSFRINDEEIGSIVYQLPTD